MVLGLLWYLSQSIFTFSIHALHIVRFQSPIILIKSIIISVYIVFFQDLRFVSCLRLYNYQSHAFFYHLLIIYDIRIGLFVLYTHFTNVLLLSNFVKTGTSIPKLSYRFKLEVRKYLYLLKNFHLNSADACRAYSHDKYNVFDEY